MKCNEFETKILTYTTQIVTFNSLARSQVIFIFRGQLHVGYYYYYWGHYATSRKVAGSNPNEVDSFN
jgi:hypothetical protein